MTSLFGHFLPKNDQMTQNNALYYNKQNVPDAWVIYQRSGINVDLLLVDNIQSELVILKGAVVYHGSCLAPENVQIQQNYILKLWPEI